MGGFNKMDINEIRAEKSKLEFEIRDSLNAFMRKTKMKVDDIDIGMMTLNLDTEIAQITNIRLSVTLY